MQSLGDAGGPDPMVRGIRVGNAADGRQGIAVANSDCGYEEVAGSGGGARRSREGGAARCVSRSERLSHAEGARGCRTPNREDSDRPEGSHQEGDSQCAACHDSSGPAAPGLQPPPAHVKRPPNSRPDQGRGAPNRLEKSKPYQQRDQTVSPQPANPLFARAAQLRPSAILSFSPIQAAVNRTSGTTASSPGVVRSASAVPRTFPRLSR